MDLLAERKSFAETDMGWYACLCGATGFQRGTRGALVARAGQNHT